MLHHSSSKRKSYSLFWENFLPKLIDNKKLLGMRYYEVTSFGCVVEESSDAMVIALVLVPRVLSLWVVLYKKETKALGTRVR